MPWLFMPHLRVKRSDTLTMEEIKKHIDNLPIELQPIYKALRKLAKKGLPNSIEMLYHNALGYSLTDSPWEKSIGASNSKCQDR
jgi:DNA-binding PadR family transcriptional regulator